MKQAPSARWLFRATGKQAKPVAVRDLVTGEIVKVAAMPREKDEFYPTPPEPTRAFLHAEYGHLRRFDTIWEPCAGDGAMVREIRAAGFHVGCSDLVDRCCGAEIQSFYDFRAPLAPAIVTNPPFAECNGKSPFVEHALSLVGVEYLALLLPFNWPGAAERAALWAREAPARVYLMRWRIDFTGMGAPPMLNLWFVWDRNAVDTQTRLLMLDCKDARKGELPGFGEYGEE